MAFPLLAALLVLIVRWLRPAGREPASIRGLTDEQILQRYRATRDNGLVHALLTRYADPIVAMGLRYLRDREDVHDLAGELFVTLQNRLLDADVDDFKRWLLRAVRNKLTDLHRRAEVRSRHAQAVIRENSVGMHSDPFEMDRDLLVRALAGLPERQRTCLELLYLEERSYDEVREQTGWTFNQVRGLRERGLKTMRDKLGGTFAGYLDDD